MKHIFYMVICMVCIFGCGNSETAVEPDSTAASDTLATNDAEESLLKSGCYRMVIQRDSAEMKLVAKGDSVWADLQYRPYEVDQSFGKFVGRIEGDKLHGWYDFHSEGMRSYRELIFKVMGDSIVEGYGEIEVSNDSAWFRFPQTVRYETAYPFLKYACE